MVWYLTSFPSLTLELMHSKNNAQRKQITRIWLPVKLSVRGLVTQIVEGPFQARNSTDQVIN
ncbi:hypothetical protein PAHAL_9G155300 [Panicum hallii]|uniref:Uncharacterized protein n=1 Tax=Panicum hallii TaxID=206008 RepID=A0A2T8I1B8_9POAL|nr:hypothetical protein PAHAL_9G155300 [Panicum hallii]